MGLANSGPPCARTISPCRLIVEMADEIGLNPYIDSMWRAKWLIVLAAVAAGAAVGLYRFKQPAVYTSQALLQIGRVWKEPIEDPYLTAELINSPSFLNQMAPKLGSKPGLVKRSIHAATVTAGPQRSGYPILVIITATGGSSSEAAAFANVTAEEVIARQDLSYDQSIRPHLEYQKQLEAILAPTGALAASQKKLAGSQPGGAGSTAQSGPAETTQVSPPPQISEALAKALHDYDEVRSFNESPSITERTRLVAEAALGTYSRASIGSPAAIAALLAALISGAAAIAFGILRGTPAANAGRTLSDRQDVPDATIG
jgi:hypothetical protein